MASTIPIMNRLVKTLESNLRCMKNITTIVNFAADKARRIGASTAPRSV